VVFFLVDLISTLFFLLYSIGQIVDCLLDKGGIIVKASNASVAMVADVSSESVGVVIMV
jgi:hypothetical protein